MEFIARTLIPISFQEFITESGHVMTKSTGKIGPILLQI